MALSEMKKSLSTCAFGETIPSIENLPFKPSTTEFSIIEIKLAA
jgi:hypothetical protein